MVFASAIFLFLFLPVTLGVYAVIHPKYRNGWLCIASFFFYAWGDWVQHCCFFFLPL